MSCDGTFMSNLKDYMWQADLENRGTDFPDKFIGFMYDSGVPELTLFFEGAPEVIASPTWTQPSDNIITAKSSDGIQFVQFKKEGESKVSMLYVKSNVEGSYNNESFVEGYCTKNPTVTIC